MRIQIVGRRTETARPFPREATPITFGLKAIFLVVAIILFIVAVFSDTHEVDLIAVGLAFFAAAFIVEEAGLAPGRRGFGRGNAP